MSNLQAVENVKQLVRMVEPDFNQLARIHNAVNFQKEASFALQILNDSEYMMSVALGNQDSLKRAIINIAAIGLTLNPILKLAYLIPRNKKIVLDISYQGLLQLAYEVGAIKWAGAEIVYSKDEYLYQGMGREPIHRFNPFGDRGEIVGAYCLAKTHDGEFILTQMPTEEILSIRDRSDSYKSGKNSPWKSDTNEMIKKTLIRRASKSWPKTSTKDQRFAQAIDVTNDYVEQMEELPAPKDDSREIKLGEIRALLKELKRSEEKYLPFLVRSVKRDVNSLSDLTEIEMDQSISVLSEMLETQKYKDKKEKANDEAPANK